MAAVCIREMEPGEEKKTFEVVRKSFREFVAPLYPPEGVRGVLRFASPEEMAKRVSTGRSFVLLGFDDDKPVGVLEVRDKNHIAMFFVLGEYQQRGVGRQLLKAAIERVRVAHPDVDAITVNASPNAEPAYERLGFRPSEPRQQQDGIIFRPMERSLNV